VHAELYLTLWDVFELGAIAIFHNTDYAKKF
jgi:hypothetical protein